MSQCSDNVCCFSRFIFVFVFCFTFVMYTQLIVGFCAHRLFCIFFVVQCAVAFDWSCVWASLSSFATFMAFWLGSVCYVLCVVILILIVYSSLRISIYFFLYAFSHSYTIQPHLFFLRITNGAFSAAASHCCLLLVDWLHWFCVIF